MKKSYMLSVLIIGIVLGASIMFLIMNKNDNDIDISIAEDERDESTTSGVRDLSWVDNVHADILDAWKSGDKTFDERLVQEVLLDMTHLKGEIHIDKGSMEITPKRIDNLVQIVQEEKAVFSHYQTYVDILNRWEKGDFSTIYDDHDLLHTLYDR